MRLNAEVMGPANGSDKASELVFLHGWGMNNAVWGAVVDPLRRRHRVTLIELPGHGGSPHRTDRAELHDWASAALAAAPTRATWIGWSLGGQLAAQAALDRPERVQALVAVAATPRFVVGDDWPHGMPAQTFDAFAAELARHPDAALSRFLALQVRGAGDARDILRRLKAALRDRPPPRAGALEAGLRLLLRTDLRARLPQLACPALWLLGGRDTLVPADVAGGIRALLPGAEVRVLPEAAHAPFLSHTPVCLQALAEFLGDPAREPA